MKDCDLIMKAEKEIYSFWPEIENKMAYTLGNPIENIIVYVLKNKIVAKREVKYLFNLYKKYPGSSITNLGGQPILTIKLR